MESEERSICDRTLRASEVVAMDAGPYPSKRILDSLIAIAVREDRHMNRR